MNNHDFDYYPDRKHDTTISANSFDLQQFLDRPIPPITPAQKAAAAQRTRRVAAEQGWDAADVLGMLGCAS